MNASAAGGGLQCLRITVGLLALWAVAWGAAAGAPPEANGPLQPGELARVHYIATVGDGLLVATSREGPAGAAASRSVWHRPQAGSGPVLVLAGQPAAFPGVGEAVVGMAPGERRQMALAPEDAFGLPDSDLVQEFPRIQRVPRRMTLAPAEFVGRFAAFPVVGGRHTFDAYLDATVLAVTAREAALAIEPRGPDWVETPVGATQIQVRPEEILITLHPRLGAAWRNPDGGRGTITQVGDESFRVDFNDRLAGKPITLEVELVSRAAPESLAAATYPWREDHDPALADARREGRPVFLLLYASWCGWTHKLLDETLEDPLVKVLMERFAWVKVASDIESEYRERYGQTGSPMIVLINASGDIQAKLEGFREAEPLAQAMRACLTRG